MGGRIKELDWLRGLAIIGVILIHVTSIKVAEGDWLALTVNQLSRFAVPGFIFLSGIGLTLGNKLESGYFKFITGQLSKIITLYLTWSLIYYLASLETQLNIISFAKGVLTGTNFYHLYYVPLIVAFYIFYPIILKVSKTKAGVTLTLLITLLTQAASSFVGFEILSSPLNPLNWLFYFSMGVWAAFNYRSYIFNIKTNYKRFFVIFVVASVIIVTESFITTSTTSMRYSVIALSVSFFLLIFSLSLKNTHFTRVLSWFSKNSYQLYLSHALILVVIQMLYAKISVDIPSIIYIPITFIAVTTVSALVSAAVDLVISRLFSIKRGRRTNAKEKTA